VTQEGKGSGQMPKIGGWARNHGGYLMLVLSPLDEFRAKRRSWPTRLLFSRQMRSEYSAATILHLSASGCSKRK